MQRWPVVILHYTSLGITMRDEHPQLPSSVRDRLVEAIDTTGPGQWDVFVYDMSANIVRWIAQTLTPCIVQATVQPSQARLIRVSPEE